MPFIRESIINFNHGEGISKKSKTRQYYTDSTSKSIYHHAGEFGTMGAVCRIHQSIKHTVQQYLNAVRIRWLWCWISLDFDIVLMVDPKS